MLRLTLRDPVDSRFLARIVERDGFAFVLDYGDEAMIEDANRRLHRGFSVVVAGASVHISPGDVGIVESEVTELVPEEMRIRALAGEGITERNSVLADLAAQALLAEE